MRKELEEMISLSDQMLVKAERSDWDAVSLLERRRNALTKRFFSRKIPDSIKESVAVGVGLILKKDREILKLSSIKKEELRASLSKMGKNRNAVQAYAASS